MLGRPALRLLAMAWSLILLLPLVSAATTEYITYQSNDGETIYLAEDRKPSLYTGNLGSCLDNSLINVTRFDASFYHDNMTLIFDIQGNTDLVSEAVMIYIGVYAYGKSRFELPFDPCKANIYSMCPVKSNVSINANGQIPLAQSDIAIIPNIAYSIPDFEGQAILRIFSNATQSEIACYSAIVTNGATFSQPAAVGSVLGAFAVIAVIASFATAIYGSDIPTTRTHYAHSLSVLVVFAVYQHIFFTGALSMNWPSVLVAFWSNYAWAAGIISTKSMQDAFDKLTHNHRGNTSMLGAAGTDTWASDVGGGYDIHQIYKRSRDYNSPTLVKTFENILSKRASSGTDNVTTTKYMGHLVRAGLPLPGNYSGFPGTLSEEGIPASNAFLTGLVWFLILILIVGGGVLLTKLAAEALIKMRRLKTDRLNYFRAHYWGFFGAALLRTCFIGFFAMMFYTIFQFSYGGATSIMAIAGVVFAIFFIGIFGLVGYACYFKLRFDTWDSIRSRYERSTVLGVIPWFHHREVIPQDLTPGDSVKPPADKSLNVDAKLAASTDKLSVNPSSTWQVASGTELQKSAHDDEQFTKKFGWLASRYRKSKWWFFAVWAVYEFVRAAFYAGASGHAMVQVFGLLVVEFIAFLTIIKMRPFEGQRLNVLMVYLLGFSKVATVALSAAFDVGFNLGRITCTAIGIVIIVIQGVVTIVLMICIVLSAITSYFSITRYREEIRPKGWNPYRARYFKHLHQAVRDRPVTPPPVLPTPPPEEPKGPYFSVNTVRRAPKIEDEDAEFMAEIARDPRMSMSPRMSMNLDTAMNSRMSLEPRRSIDPESSLAHADTAMDITPATEEYTRTPRMSRAMSSSSHRSSSNIPYGARIHRGSWSTRDFNDYYGTSPHPNDGDGDISHPSLRQYPSLRGAESRDGLRSALHSRAASASFAEEVARAGQVSPVRHGSPAAGSPVISRSSSLREMSSGGAASIPLPPINTALARAAEVGSPPRSPGSPSRPRSRLQKQRANQSIDEGNEGTA